MRDHVRGLSGSRPSPKDALVNQNLLPLGLQGEPGFSAGPAGGASSGAGALGAE